MKLIGYIEKVEEEELECEPETGEEMAMGNAAAVGEGEAGEAPDDNAAKQTDKGKEQDDTEDPKKKPHIIKSVNKLREQWRQAKVHEQEKQWREVIAKGLGEAPVGKLDLEDVMMSPEEEEKQKEGEKQEEGYGKVYMKTHEKHGARSISRAERREQEEQKKKEEAAKKAAQEVANWVAADEVKRIIEREQLDEEEMAVQKRLECKRKLQAMVEE